MKILGISSVTRNCGVAVSENGETLGDITLSEGRGLSESLMPAIDRILRDAGLTVGTLDGIAVTAGPGSFTGIKVGLAAAKGLALAASVRAVGISTLEALAWSAGPREHPLYAVINAGRGEVFAGCYSHSNNRLEPLMPDGLFAPEAMDSIVKGPAFLIGDAASQIHDLLNSHRQNAAISLIPAEAGLPLAVAVAQLGMARLAGGNTLTAASLLPLYIRRAEAEVQLERKQMAAADRSCPA
ncbi:MAG: tRNA (adenosine(37)-N6)-threonylcarbamoyltransferase complex dimerization subunit type 1 TsaB [Nitrospirota bacterium]|nr:tRNA (adenosine(37)-N6)-threonylcarbamoyltransferase complex dimerization subunit type 1 TsaB [Nitrospirota bacterium]